METPIYVLFMNENFIINKNKTGFYIEIDSNNYRILETTRRDGTTVDGILPTLTSKGEFVWAFGQLAIADDLEARRMTVHLLNSNTGETHSRTVHLGIVNHFTPKSYPHLEVREVNGITILENRSNTESGSREELREAFYNSGNLLRDKPVLILDLRAHQGGVSLLANDWMRGYTGHEQINQFAFYQFNLATFTSMELIGVERSRVQELINDNAFNPPEWRLPGITENKIIQNENLVIVLMDKGTSSTGERFVGYLRQLENVIFVGTNTRGGLTFAGLAGTTLPYSGIDISFGVNLTLRSDLSKFEGLGFMPDLWVQPEESLERVIHFIERYKLVN